MMICRRFIKAFGQRKTRSDVCSTSSTKDNEREHERDRQRRPRTGGPRARLRAKRPEWLLRDHAQVLPVAAIRTAPMMKAANSVRLDKSGDNDVLADYGNAEGYRRVSSTLLSSKVHDPLTVSACSGSRSRPRECL